MSEEEPLRGIPRLTRREQAILDMARWKRANFERYEWLEQEGHGPEGRMNWGEKLVVFVGLLVVVLALEKEALLLLCLINTCLVLWLLVSVVSEFTVPYIYG